MKTSAPQQKELCEELPKQTITAVEPKALCLHHCSYSRVTTEIVSVKYLNR